MVTGLFIYFQLFSVKLKTEMNKTIKLVSWKTDDYNEAHPMLLLRLTHVVIVSYTRTIQDISGVTSASTRCHSTAVHGLYTAAACLCGTLYSLDKSAVSYTVRGV